MQVNEQTNAKQSKLVWNVPLEYLSVTIPMIQLLPAESV